MITQHDSSLQGYKKKSLYNFIFWWENYRFENILATLSLNYFSFHTDDIWASAKPIAKEKIDSIQYRASKIITGAVSSTNTSRLKKECGLTPLENRKKLYIVNFTNNIRSLLEDHIFSRTFRKWSLKSRLKRSSILKQNWKISKAINLQHQTLTIMKEPFHTLHLYPQTMVNENLLWSCTNKELSSIIKEKGNHTIKVLIIHSQKLVIAYTDGSSDPNLDRWGASWQVQMGNTNVTKLQFGKSHPNSHAKLMPSRKH